MLLKHVLRVPELYWGYRDYEGALAELEVARQSLPNDARILRQRVISRGVKGVGKIYAKPDARLSSTRAILTR